jgi:hypothetical protein
MPKRVQAGVGPCGSTMRNGFLESSGIVWCLHVFTVISFHHRIRSLNRRWRASRAFTIHTNVIGLALHSGTSFIFRFKRCRLSPTHVLRSPSSIGAGLAQPYQSQQLCVCARVHSHVQMGDQQAAAYGCACMHVGDTMVSLGTGTFVDMNTAAQPHASLRGLYPVVGWRLPAEPNHQHPSLVHFAEGHSHDTATTINWAVRVGLIDDLTTCSQVWVCTRLCTRIMFLGGGKCTPHTRHVCVFCPGVQRSSGTVQR